MISSNGHLYETRLVFGNIRRVVRAEVAERCRLGSGLLRSMLLTPRESWYGDSCGYGDVSRHMGDLGFADGDEKLVAETR